MKSLTLFNNKGGVGKTTLTFHLAHMFARLGKRVLVLDYDPQCNQSANFLEESALFDLWEDSSRRSSNVAGCLEPVRIGKGEVRAPEPIEVAPDLWLLPGELSLGLFEQVLAEEWPKTLATSNERALDVTTALDLLSNLAAERVSADYVFIDIGPSLGALNRAAVLACDAVVLPLAPDLFSLQGMRNLGPTLRDWREDWTLVRMSRMTGRSQTTMPTHEFQPIGYIVQQHLARADRPTEGYAKWAREIPLEFQSRVIGDGVASVMCGNDGEVDFAADPYCLATVRHFASLVPLAQLARKPMFDLKQADGIGGVQFNAVARCKREFEVLANRLIQQLSE